MSAIASAADWIAAVLTGKAATAVATIAVATAGLQMLGGRISLDRGARIVLGCFLIFGAPLLAAAFTGAAPAQAPAAPSPQPQQVRQAPPPPAFDPYAGAAVPVR